jgi:M6 family metalloprotease-like protein
MKNNIIAITISLLLIFAASCTYNPYESVKKSESGRLFKANKKIELKGKHAASAGELKTLIVYAMFADDIQKKSEAWPYSKTSLPAWTKNMINSSTHLNFPQNNLTQYFYEMSNGNFMLYGDVYPEVVIPKFDQKNYKSISEVNHEILMSLDDKIDYSKYDNWTRDVNGKYVNQSDGKVDVVFIVYRNFENRLFFGNGWTGSAHFYLSENIKTNDGVSINQGRLDLGSGIQSRGAYNGFTYLKYVLAHEFGHLLFGAGHIENVTNHALMTGGPVWNASRGMHSWEKARLGWSDYVDIPLNKNSKLKIEDVSESSKTYRIKLSDKEWIILENHQNLSANDWAIDKGIYIYKVRNGDRFAPQINIECADGNWDFSIDKENKKLIRTIPNLSGKTEMNFRKNLNGKSYACYNEVYGDKSAWGDEYDAFDLKFNNLYSPVSNPSSKNSSKIDFAIEVIEENTVNVLFENIYENTQPAKPQILDFKSENGKKYILSWLPNGEPDLKGYNIYLFNKIKNTTEKYNYVAAKKGVESINYDISNLIAQKGNTPIVFVTALDKSGKESVRSNYAEIYFDKSKNIWTWIRTEEY